MAKQLWMALLHNLSASSSSAFGRLENGTASHIAHRLCASVGPFPIRSKCPLNLRHLNYATRPLWIFFLFVCVTLDATELSIVEKEIVVNGKNATVFAIAQPDGTLGIFTNIKQNFHVLLKNTLNVPTSIHWHGLILPNSQDGVAFVTQFPLYPHLSYLYEFPLLQSGTFWMHSHFALQEQKQLSAPLIIRDDEDEAIANQEVILFLSDFSFKSPSDIYRSLKCSKMDKVRKPDIIDVQYDALLTNYRTLDNPEVITVEKGKKVRLRIINGASATNFFLHLGDLEGEAIAVDGNKIAAFTGKHFELAVAQRIDIVVTIPETGGAFPIIAQGEATDMLTGLVLATGEAALPKLSSKASQVALRLTNEQEAKLQAVNPLRKRIPDRRLTVELGGNMNTYEWTLNGQVWPEVTPLTVEKNQRVEILFKNNTSMSHPMHLHGHVFQVTAINDEPIDGAMRDTVLVMPNSSLAIQFEANNPGVWPLHCHILYHLEAGMFTVLRYEGFIQPL